MSEAVEHEIRTLQSLFWSERDPEGLAFAPLAEAFLAKGEVRKALELLNDGTSRHPDFATGHVVAARLYFEQGMSAEAEIAARRVLDLDAENIVALSVLGSVLEERGDPQAGEVRAALVDADPDSDQARAVAGAPEPPAAGAGVVQPPPLPDGVEPQSDLELDPWTPTEVADTGDAPFEEALGLSDEDGDASDEPAQEDDLEAALGALGLDDEPEDGALDVPQLAGLELAGLDLGGEGEPADALDLAALAPDEPALPAEDDALDLSALAPDEPTLPAEDDALDLAALAPDEPTLPAEDDALDLSALAPDEPVLPAEDDALDLAALAPDEPVLPTQDDALDLAALAPDEPVLPTQDDALELAALAPDEPTLPAEDDALDLSALAPDEPVLPTQDDALDLAALAPDEPALPAEDDALDLAALAPDPPAAEADGAPPADEPVVELGALAPDPDVLAEAALEPADDSEEDPHMDSNEPVYTRTLAELYVKQGFTDRALDVYRHLLSRNPGADDIRARIAQIEAGEDVEPRGVASAAETSAPDASLDVEAPAEDAALDMSALAPEASLPEAPEPAGEDETEAMARDLADLGAPDTEVDTPFAWSDEEASEARPARDGEGVGSYFDELLGWEQREE